MVLKGLSAFPITPADADGRVDVAALRRLVARLAVSRIDSIGLLGSTGTYAYLDRAQRRRALEAALDEAGGRVPIIVGVGALRTDEAIALAQDAKAAGAAAGLLAPVSYTPLGDDEVFEHFRAVAEASRLPLCIYDNPATTHFTFGADLVGHLAALPGCIALKCAAPKSAALLARLHELRAAVSDRFSIGFSGDWNCTEALIAGGDAWYSVVAGLFPESAAGIVQAVRRGDVAEARRLDARLRPLWDLFQRFSSLRVMYACAEHLGLGSCEPPRPILPLRGEARRAVSQVLQALELS